MKRRPSLLFVAPILPAQTGNGLAMRAGVFLDALARDFQVSLLVVPVAGNADGRVASFVHRSGLPVSSYCRSMASWIRCGSFAAACSIADKRATAWADYPASGVLPLRDDALPERGPTGVRRCALRRCSRHAQLSRSLCRTVPARRDSSPIRHSPVSISTTTRRSRIAVWRRCSNAWVCARDAGVETAEAAKYERHEATWLPRFRQLITCSAADAQKFARTYRDHIVAAIANTVVVPQQRVTSSRGR